MAWIVVHASAGASRVDSAVPVNDTH